MNPVLFFDPVDEDFIKEMPDPYAYGLGIYAYTGPGLFPTWQEADIALIGLTEDRGSSQRGIDEGANAIRSQLYTLKNGTRPYRIVDLGNLRNGPSLEETHKRIAEVIQYLIHHRIIPIFFGGSHDLSLGVAQGFQLLEEALNISIIDAKANISLEEYGSSLDEGFIAELQIKNLVKHGTLIGYQSFLTHAEELKLLANIPMDYIRLGKAKEDIAALEPVLRKSNYLSVDVESIARSSFPGHKAPRPFGFNGEELCQLAWYAGQNNALQVVSFHNYSILEDENDASAFLLATAIWYLIEGIQHRKPDEPMTNNYFTHYTVPFSTENIILSFYHGKNSGKWWMDLGENDEKKLIPCRKEDYELAKSGKIPDLYLKAISS